MLRPCIQPSKNDRVRAVGPPYTGVRSAIEAQKSKQNRQMSVMPLNVLPIIT